MRRIAILLHDRFPPPKKMSNWEPKLVALIIKNTVYKGEFIAHRWQEVKIPKAVHSVSLTEAVGKTGTRKGERPREEWIRVPVPAIISEEQWELANKMLEKNYQMGRRNATEPYLLTGLIKCATCGYTFVGGRKKNIGRHGQIYRFTYYRCTSRGHRVPHVIKAIGCDQGQIACHTLDDAVWSVIYSA